MIRALVFMLGCSGGLSPSETADGGVAVFSDSFCLLSLTGGGFVAPMMPEKLVSASAHSGSDAFQRALTALALQACGMHCVSLISRVTLLQLK